MPEHRQALVFIADHGYHSSLILPDRYGDYIEFAYGAHKRFAKNVDGCWSVVTALFWPTQGCLGRRLISDIENRDDLTRKLDALHVSSLIVDQVPMRQLEWRLTSHMESQRSEIFYNDVVNMEFAPFPQKYWFMNTCNDVLADWLRELGCEVTGRSFTANFEVVSPSRNRSKKGL